MGTACKTIPPAHLQEHTQNIHDILSEGRALGKMWPRAHWVPKWSVSRLRLSVAATRMLKTVSPNQARQMSHSWHHTGGIETEDGQTDRQPNRHGWQGWQG